MDRRFRVQTIDGRYQVLDTFCGQVLGPYLTATDAFDVAERLSAEMDC